MQTQQRKISKEEKIVRLLDYLKKYTDEKNPASIPQIERYFRAEGYTNFFGTKNTRQKMIKEMTRAINTDVNGNLLPREEWRVVYNDFIKENTPGNEAPKAHHIVNIYYKKEFQDREVLKIIESIRNNAQLPEEQKDILICKVKKYLTNNNYLKHPRSPAERRADERQQREVFLIDIFWKRFCLYFSIK